MRLISQTKWAALFLGLALCATTNAKASEALDSTRFIVGPGDAFSVSFFDAAIEKIEFEVSVEGKVTIPTVGSYSISGLTLMNAKSILRAALNNTYSGSRFSVDLDSVRSKRIIISGAVSEPGVYVASASDRVTDIIALAGGLTPIASKRNITLKSGAKTVAVDLIRFESLGDFAANPPLYLGDMITVPPLTDSASRIHVSGAVNRPGSVEFTGRDNLAELILIAGGVSSQGDPDSIAYFPGGEESGQQSRITNSSDTEILDAGSHLIVAPIKISLKTKDVFISGQVRRPGRYPLSSSTTLTDLLDLAGGALEDAYLPGVQIYNELEDGKISSDSEQETIDDVDGEEISFEMRPNSRAHTIERRPNPRTHTVERRPNPVAHTVRAENVYDYDSNSPARVKLISGDSIFVPRFEGLVTALGRVKNPGRVVFAGPASPADMIRLAGGAASRADFSRSWIYRKHSGVALPYNSTKYALDGDIIVIAQKERGSSILGTLRDVALIGAGIALSVFAIDQAGQ